MVRLVGIIKRRVEIGIAVSVTETDFGQLLPQYGYTGGLSIKHLQVLGRGVLG